MRTRLRRVFRVPIPLGLVLSMLGLAIALAGFGGYAAALRATSPCPLAADVCAGFTNFWRAWRLVSAHYVEPEAIDPRQMTEGAIHGLIESLGDHNHTRYLSPEAARAEQEFLSGHFAGIGAYIDVRDDQPIIVRPIEGTPAERAGLRPDDVILRVDGQDVRGITVDELQAMVRGPAGMSVTLTIRHEGEELPIDIAITRQEIDVPSVSWSMLANGIALIRIIQFSEGTSEELKQALAGAKAACESSPGVRASVVNMLMVIVAATTCITSNTTTVIASAGGVNCVAKSGVANESSRAISATTRNTRIGR